MSKSNGESVFEFGTKSILSDHMKEVLLKGFADRNPGKILDSDEFAKILKWAEETVISNKLLEGIIDGDILPSVDGKGNVVFSVSSQGIERAEKQDHKFIKVPNSEKIQ